MTKKTTYERKICMRAERLDLAEMRMLETVCTSVGSTNVKMLC
jgi:hypothetical protein